MLRHFGNPFPLPLLHDRHGAERQQTHHRVELQPGCSPLGTAKDVVIKAVVLIPHAIRSDLVHGMGDQHKVGRKFSAKSSYAGSLDASSTAISIMFCEQ